MDPFLTLNVKKWMKIQNFEWCDSWDVNSDPHGSWGCTTETNITSCDDMFLRRRKLTPTIAHGKNIFELKM